ncbi:M48 family metallopeptidase [Streptomyces sp. NBC_01384]|uniref:YgjP-like metallopeptidase domain-containing protein n=1 Tax=Streptomyces sp. NBC_01384 TaxID=2903847 RepID=UPI0032545F33
MTAQLAQDVRSAITSHGRFTKHIHDVKVSTRRKSLGMTMKPGDPGVTLHVPADARPEEVVTLLVKNSHRLGAMLVKARECVPDHPVKELVNGSGFLWLGRSARLRIVDSAIAPLERVTDGHWWMQLRHDVVPQGAKPFIDWYTREGTAWLNQEAEAPYWWARMAPGQPMPSVSVADIGRKRWGIHDGHTNSIRIAWQTLQLSVPIVRHVLIHELTHALVRSGSPHGPEFWRAFERTRIGAQEEARRLHEEGRHVWMGDVARRAAS